MRKSLMKFAILDIHYRKFYIVRRKNSPELIKWQQSLVGRFIDIHLQPQFHKFLFILVQVKQSYSISANNPRNIYVSHSLSELFTAIPYSYVFVSLARILFPKKTLHIKMSFMEFSSGKGSLIRIFARRTKYHVTLSRSVPSNSILCIVFTEGLVAGIQAKFRKMVSW